MEVTGLKSGKDLTGLKKRCLLQPATQETNLPETASLAELKRAFLARFSAPQSLHQHAVHPPARFVRRLPSH